MVFGIYGWWRVLILILGERNLVLKSESRGGAPVSKRSLVLRAKHYNLCTAGNQFNSVDSILGVMFAILELNKASFPLPFST